MSLEQVVVAAGHAGLPDGLLDLAQPLDLRVEEDLGRRQLDAGRRREGEQPVQRVKVLRALRRVLRHQRVQDGEQQGGEKPGDVRVSVKA